MELLETGGAVLLGIAIDQLSLASMEQGVQEPDEEPDSGPVDRAEEQE